MSEPQKPEQKPAGDPYRDLGEITIEVATKHCGSLQFCAVTPARNLRGRWDRSKLYGESINGPLSQMPDIPGMYISIDPKRRRARIYDPLTLEENKDLLYTMEKIWNQTNQEAAGPGKETIRENMDDTQIKTYLHWMRRAVDDRCAREIPGSARLPSLKEIARLPGKTRVEIRSNLSRNVKYLEDMPEGSRMAAAL